MCRTVLLDGLKTLFGRERMNALPALLCSDEALMPLVGFKAQHVRQGVCPRGAATRQGERTPGPISPETLANNIVKLNVRDLEGVFNGAIRALAKRKAIPRLKALRISEVDTLVGISHEQLDIFPLDTLSGSPSS